MSKWQKIETLDKSVKNFDLFGWIDYDCIEMRLTDCDYDESIDSFRYFQAGELIPVSDIGFHATHWMVVPDPSDEDA